jgi:hypothetical protein
MEQQGCRICELWRCRRRARCRALTIGYGSLHYRNRRRQVPLSLFTNFENFKTLKPSPQREKELNKMLDQLVAWGAAMKTVRFEAAKATRD